MNILNKFSKVQIDPTKTLLKGADLEFCTKLEADYETAFRFFELEREFITINREANTFLEFEDYLDNVLSKIRNLNQKFIHKTIYYFRDKYTIALEEEKIEQKIYPEFPKRRYDSWRYKDEELEKKLSLSQILNPISEFLNGMTLDEKAESEIKENFYENFAKLYHHEKPRVELNKNRIEFFLGRFCFDTSWSNKGYKFTYNSEKMARKLLVAFSLFENGSTEINSEFLGLVDGAYDPEMFSEKSFNLEKIKSIRFYKNGKTVVKFGSDELAVEFFKTFCRNGT